MAQRYEPGTVAVATVRGVEGVRVFRIASSHDGAASWFTATSVDHTGGRYHREDDVTDVRPLVVLDPEDSAQVTRLLDAYVRPFESFVTPQRIAIMQDALRAQTRPPKPPEPTGLGAVVKDREGKTWVGIGGGFFAQEHPGSAEWKYDDIDAVEVLSDGVTP